MVVRLGRGAAPTLRPSVTGGDVRLHADDRFDLRLFGLLLELPGGVEISVVGDRQGRLLELLGAADQVVDPVCAVKKRVFRVAMEVHEGNLGECSVAAQAVSKRLASISQLVSVFISTV